MRHAVHIAAHGVVCARGLTAGEAAAAILRGECAAAGPAPGHRALPYFSLPLPERDWRQRAESALRHLKAQLPGLPAKTPLFLASSSYQIGEFEAAARCHDLPLASASFAPVVQAALGLDGPLVAHANACVSAFSAIETAAALIAAGHLSSALVLGFELANLSTLAGFDGMALLSATACRPLDAGRDGLVLGEAVAAILLTRAAAPWRVAGIRVGLDAHSLTGPDPAGGVIADVMTACLTAAGQAASALPLVKLQAAGSPGTDLAEAHALRRVFTERMPPLLSLKPFIGHTLGASGAAELSLMLALMEAGVIPATPGFSEADPALGLAPTREALVGPIDRALLNLIGFGGGVASLLVERV